MLCGRVVGRREKEVDAERDVAPAEVAGDRIGQRQRLVVARLDRRPGRLEQREIRLERRARRRQTVRRALHFERALLRRHQMRLAVLRVRCGHTYEKRRERVRSRSPGY